MSLYGDHIIVAEPDGSGEVRGHARRLLLRQAVETLDLIKGVLVNFKLMEAHCDQVGFFWEDDKPACPYSGEENDKLHFHMAWKAEVLNPEGA